mmetsp:Transcript_44925/g.52646  ORF Transcript_44925/g.52646 Transcript_44925/m.52646 type:complete len:120 (-) Transcript_44925:1719-2078(-)
MQPKVTKATSMIFSKVLSFGPNILRCAPAGNITLTTMVHIKPTREHKRLKEGRNIATIKEPIIKPYRITFDAISFGVSPTRNGSTISSMPRERGNMSSVNLEKVVSTMSHIIIVRAVPA